MQERKEGFRRMKKWKREKDLSDRRVLHRVLEGIRFKTLASYNIDIFNSVNVKKVFDMTGEGTEKFTTEEIKEAIRKATESPRDEETLKEE